MTMWKYLGVETTNPETGEIQIICETDADALALANDLMSALSTRDAGPVVDAYRITYRGNVRLLAQFLALRNWQLVMDTRTRLIFQKAALKQ